jgi:nucleotide-binding universal stress UspA family protein
MILIAYDGSEDSKAAVARAGTLFPGESTTVLMVWQRFIETMARAGVAAGVIVDYESIDESAEKGAADTAEAGAQLARDAGLDASGAAGVVTTTTAEAILAEAEKLDASVVILGSRGRTGVRSLMLGSVSHAVLQHADRPVLVVPSPHIAAERAKRLAEAG